MKTNTTTLIPYDNPVKCKYSKDGLSDLVNKDTHIYKKILERKKARRGKVIGERTFKNTTETMYVVLWDNNLKTTNIAKDYIDIIG